MIASISAFAFDPVADQQQRAADPEDRVERHRDHDHQQGQLQRVQAVGRGDRVERRADPVFEGLVEDHHQRDQQQQGQVAEAGDAQAPAARRGGAHRASSAAGVGHDRRGDRSTVAAFVAARPALDQRDDAEQQQRGDEQDDRDGRGADVVAGLDLLADEDRGDHRLRQAAGEDQDRAELAQRPREGERDAGGEAGEEVGEDDAAEDREVARAERGRRGLHLAVHLEQQRLHGADDEGQGDEHQRDDDRGAGARRGGCRSGCRCRRARAG